MRKFLTRFAPQLRRLTVIGCLGLSLVVLFVWVRSFYAGETYRAQTRDILGAYTTWRIRTGEGICALVIDRFDFSDNPQAGVGFAQTLDRTNRFGSPGYSRRRPGPPIMIQYPSQSSLLGSLGFQSYRRSDEASGSDHTLYVFAMPFWALFFLAIAYPLTCYVGGVVRRQREDRIALGLCPTCGVPMSEDQSRCPGCDKPMALARQV